MTAAKAGGSPRGVRALGGGELSGARGRTEPHYRKCLEAFGRMTPAELQRRQEFIDRATRELGFAAGRLQAGGPAGGSGRLDLFPRILRLGEWERIEAGVLQRARAFSAYAADIYNGREILHAGVVPAELALEDPCFHPELHGVPAGDGGPVTVGAVDLLRTAAGDWQVLENRFSTPTGISEVIHIRRILAQALPELFASLPVVPVAGFAARLSEALAAQAPPGAGQAPLIVLLSAGESGRHFFEESFLARHMGIPLALPQDLVVRDGRVFLKTIAGLLAVDVIHRRMEPPLLDPVAFASGGESGLPGLLQCVRRGSVRVANGLGCAVADNRALLRFSGDIIRFYTGERALLRTVPTYTGFDRDQEEWIEEHIGGLLLKPVCNPAILRRAVPQAGALACAEDLARLFRADPRRVVAQQLPPAAQLPVYRDGAFAPQPLVMRVFCILGRRPYVLPGGLTRVLAPGPGHAFKDTWALRERRTRAPRSGRLEPQISLAGTPLPSRAAEGCYWIGRYLERARGTARMLNILEELRWDELVPAERALYAPLYKALIDATGQKLRLRPGRPGETVQLTRSLLLDAANPASVRSCLNAALWNASGIRSFITPEFWRGIQGAVGRLEARPAARPGGTRLRDLIEEVVDACDRVHGAGERTLLHDPGWHFISTGMLLERAQGHVVILADVLPHIARRQCEHLRDDTDLTALLRLLGALDAYHRHYRSRAYLDRVAQLLWQSPSCTSSVLFAARGIRAALRAIVDEAGEQPAAAGLQADLDAFIGWLEAIPLASIFPARAVELDRGLTRRNLSAERTIREAERCLGRMQTFLEELNLQLEDGFFSHHPANGGST